ncbi:MAG: enoyl-CoA hydratase/isomerase family protein [Bacteroidetes bacterium]|nr:enoyl-CoA hydratase/isomerase family protein [Bacteroidota bacterium]
MAVFETLKVGVEIDVATISLNRPEIRNAFNEVMIAEVTNAFTGLEKDEAVRVILLKGEGKAFCAGADLNWMRSVAGYSFQQNYEESYKLSRCFYSIYNSTKPTIAVVHGAAIGGANGLLAACDIALCDTDTVFSLSEVKIGIVPACISPYVIKRVGEYGARELMLTGRRINGTEAEHYRLVNKSLNNSELQDYLSSMVDLLKTSGPKAIAHCKNLINEVSNNITLDEALSYTAHMIAEIRASEEGQEGMAAFLEKRPPRWVK